MRNVVVHGKKRVYDGFFKIDEADVSYERFDGAMNRVRRLCFERGDSVAALIFNRDSQRALFVNQFKYPAYEKGPGWIVEPVAGTIETGETPDAALRREVLEETGYELDAFEPIAVFYVSPGGSSERVFLYYAEVSGTAKVAAGGGVASEGEDIQTLELSLEELQRMLTQGQLHDAKTIIGAQWLLERRRGTVGR